MPAAKRKAKKKYPPAVTTYATKAKSVFSGAKMTAKYRGAKSTLVS